MKISCFDKELQEILETGYYEVPRFQRPYSWQRENVEDFWQDTIVNSESDYFIGSIVVYKAGSNVRGIVDGQQRLTTITMLLCALRDAFAAASREDLAIGLHKLIERPDITNSARFIIHTESSYPYLQECIQKFGDPDVEPEIGEEEELLKESFEQICGYVTDTVVAIEKNPSLSKTQKQAHAISALCAIRDKLLHLKLIFIELDDEDDAYIAFETLNTRGLDLTVAHLVKNHLTKLLRARNARVDLPKEKWAKLVGILEESEADLPIEQFLHHFWLSKYDYTTVKKLFKEIKRRIDKSSAKEFLDTLVSEAAIYREIHEPSFRRWTKDERKLIPRSLDALTLFRVKQPVPIVLSVMREYHAGRIKLKHAGHMLRAIENFHFIFTAIASQRSSGGISFMYALHGRQLLGATNIQAKIAGLTELRVKLQSKLPSFQEFDASFRQLAYSEDFTKQKKLVQYVLAKVCEYLSDGVVVDYEQMTIEHLASQRPRSGVAIVDTDVASIGNLVLVNAKLNEKLANKTFREKKAILMKSHVPLDDVVKNASDWTAKQIDERAHHLSELAYKKIWAIR